MAFSSSILWHTFAHSGVARVTFLDPLTKMTFIKVLSNLETSGTLFHWSHQSVEKILSMELVLDGELRIGGHFMVELLNDPI